MTKSTQSKKGKGLARLGRLLRPLGVPALLALMLAAWPITLPLFWIAVLFGLIWLSIRQHSPSAVKARAEAERIRKQEIEAVIDQYEREDLVRYGLLDTPENRDLVASWNSYRELHRKKYNKARDDALKALADAGLKQPAPRTWQEAEGELCRRYGLAAKDDESDERLRAGFIAWRNATGLDEEGFLT